MKEVGASKRLGHLIEGESLINDGSAYVFFLIFFDMVIGEGRSGGATVGYFCQLVSVAALIGAAFGVATTLFLLLVYRSGSPLHPFPPHPCTVPVPPLKHQPSTSVFLYPNPPDSPTVPPTAMQNGSMRCWSVVCPARCPADGASDTPRTTTTCFHTLCNMVATLHLLLYIRQHATVA